MTLRPVLTLRLYRQNRHVEPSIGRDVGDIVLLGVLGFLWYVVVVLVCSL